MNETYTVSQLSKYIKSKFDSDFLLGCIYVKGEVSNCKYHTSGHIYFTLKDSNAQIACVMFAGQRAGISFRLQDGQSVVVFGRVSVYEASGRYQIYADEIKPLGIGELYEKYEELKKKLGAEGLFDVSHKKSVPKYAMRVGIVTASTGAAIRDICTISKRRNPYVQLFLFPAQVQGEGASDTIVRGIKALDGKVDVMIVGRGGGSIEDLWAFNEEQTVRAIYECQTPVISAVGHETDTTLADFAADLRAATPSEGAELAVFDLSLFLKNLAIYHERILDAMMFCIDERRKDIERYRLMLKAQNPRVKLENAKERIGRYPEALRKAFSYLFSYRKNELTSVTKRFISMNPLKKLESGFSYVVNDDHVNITRISQVDTDDDLSVFVTDGVIKTKVIEVVSDVKY